MVQSWLWARTCADMARLKRSVTSWPKVCRAASQDGSMPCVSISCRQAEQEQSWSWTMSKNSPVHGRQQREHFIDVRLEEVDVRSVQAELGIEAGLVGPLALNRAVGCNLQPLRLVLRGVVVPLYGGIDRQADVAGVGGFDLLGQ